MSDLVPFVAAVVRDRCVEDLQRENETLKRKVETSQQEIKKLQKTVDETRTLSITGPLGWPVYAMAQLDDGFQLDSDVPRWYVELTTQPNAICSHNEIESLQIGIGDLGKDLKDQDDSGELVYFQDYDDATGRADITLFGAAPAILHGNIGPISEEQYDTLSLNHQEVSFAEFRRVVDELVVGNTETEITVEFVAVKFNNHAHTLWHSM